MQDRKQKQRDKIRAECARRSVTITPRGLGFELRGVGVSLRVLDLADLESAERVPFVSSSLSDLDSGAMRRRAD